MGDAEGTETLGEDNPWLGKLHDRGDTFYSLQMEGDIV